MIRKTNRLLSNKRKFYAHLPPVNRLADPNRELLLSSYLIRLIPCAKGQPESERCVKYVPFICPVPSQPDRNGHWTFIQHIPNAYGTQNKTKPNRTTQHTKKKK